MLSKLENIQFEDFLKIDIRVGTIIEDKSNSQAKKPFCILKIVFGELGIKMSSAQITENYKSGQLLG